MRDSHFHQKSVSRVVCDGICVWQHRFAEMCEDMWFGGGSHKRCTSPIVQFEQIQEHYWCKEFWGF